MERTIILAHGAYPTHPVPRALLQHAQTIICTDGAVNDLEEGLVPRWIIGDLDSLNPEIRQKYASRIVYVGDKETNDLTKAVNFCVSWNIRRLTILGATGLREDHMLGNFSLLGTYARLLEQVQMVTDAGRFTVLTQPARIPCRKGASVSFFAFDPALKLQVEGVRYPVRQVVFDALWKGTLNECTEEFLEITFSNGPVAAYFTF